MVYAKNKSIEIMNDWGSKRIPFLFIIDFEMKAIRLFQLDSLPSGVDYSFPNLTPKRLHSKLSGQYYFRKYPVPLSQYQPAFLEVKRQILSGNSFLLNLTFPTRIETDLTLQKIYEFSHAKYKLLIDDEFLVFSPETFVTFTNGVISSYPMKGTIKATCPHASQKLLNNPKEIAEHNTIVDLIRNDLSMIAKDIKVKRFRYIDKVSTNEEDILQVSSEIAGNLPKDYHKKLGDLIFTLLPAGSVTGAPKMKTINIIRSVEQTERGYYTGVFGYFDGINLDSAVMIRFIEHHENILRFRSGGGITCNSLLESEYQELIDKVYVPLI
jgi:para-aminobenzoate synthetase component I